MISSVLSKLWTTMEVSRSEKKALQKGCWEIRRYNGRHTCSMGTISQHHSKLDSNTIAEAMKPLVESNPSIKVKSIIVEVQARFNYSISYRKAWLGKQKSISKVFGRWKESDQALPLWFSVPYSQKLVVNIRYSRIVEEYNINYKRWSNYHVTMLLLAVLYTMYEIRKVYRMEFVPLGDTERWPDYPGPTIVANPALK
ncbi:hypothetical protein Ahy_B06g080056 [Arachis hypogaea]|uniref:Uncharacterized protein n=1 Tax=Arachis hypogaea TaxID=3818 RepID=A0A444YH06_ARAHY|nr:hypothetical protein Ahy_B06g080056 [Arachis hypogaea]